MVAYCLQSQRPEWAIEIYYTTGTQNKIDCFNVEGYCADCNKFFELMDFYSPICSWQEDIAGMPQKETQRWIQNNNMTNWDEIICGAKDTMWLI